VTETPLTASDRAVVETHPEGFSVELEDGSYLLVPWCVSWPLAHAWAVDTYVCRLSHDRAGIMWPRLWYSVRLAHLIELARAGGGPIHLPAGATRSAA